MQVCRLVVTYVQETCRLVLKHVVRREGEAGRMRNEADAVCGGGGELMLEAMRNF